MLMKKATKREDEDLSKSLAIGCIIPNFVFKESRWTTMTRSKRALLDKAILSFLSTFLCYSSESSKFYFHLLLYMKFGLGVFIFSSFDWKEHSTIRHIINLFQTADTFPFLNIYILKTYALQNRTWGLFSVGKSQSMRTFMWCW